jgi:threonine dehydrogenase-like Zn-dependent dehydrogenase
MATARAVIQTADRALEVWDLPVPEVLAPGEALLRVEGNGICGHDYSRFVGEHGHRRAAYPVACGHEPVGRIERIGADAKRLWNVDAGDRVAVEVRVSCHVCPSCRSGAMRYCTNAFLYGLSSAAPNVGLWGGFGEYMVLRPNTIVHRLPEALSVEDAVLYNPLGAAIDWIDTAQVKPGDTVLVFGPGQRGLAAVVAAAERGAGRIIVTGLSRDAHKLELARKLGAHDTINAETGDVVEQVHALTAGFGARRIIDCAPGSGATIVDAIKCVARAGTIVVAGQKRNEPLPALTPLDLRKDFDLRFPNGATSPAYGEAIDIISAHRYPLEAMHTHVFDLEHAEYGIRLLGGEADDAVDPIHITIVPS